MKVRSLCKLCIYLYAACFIIAAVSFAVFTYFRCVSSKSILLLEKFVLLYRWTTRKAQHAAGYYLRSVGHTHFFSCKSHTFIPKKGCCYKYLYNM